MPRGTQEPPSSMGRVTRSARQRVVSYEGMEAPTQIQRNVRKRKNAPTASPPQKRARHVAIKKAGRNVPSPPRETDPETTGPDDEDYQEPEETPPKMSAKKYRGLLKTVLNEARNFNWAPRAIERGLEHIRVRRAPAEREDEEEPEMPVRHLKKEPVKRKKPVPWSEDEERFLIRKICEKGAKWSSFQENYAHGELFGRDQTAIKDKARNIMRKIIDSGREEEWIAKYPLWSQVTVGQARRGVHGYDGNIPRAVPKPDYTEEMLQDD